MWISYTIVALRTLLCIYENKILCGGAWTMVQGENNMRFPACYKREKSPMLLPACCKREKSPLRLPVYCKRESHQRFFHCVVRESLQCSFQLVVRDDLREVVSLANDPAMWKKSSWRHRGHWNKQICWMGKLVCVFVLCVRVAFPFSLQVVHSLLSVEGLMKSFFNCKKYLRSFVRNV